MNVFQNFFKINEKRTINIFKNILIVSFLLWMYINYKNWFLYVFRLLSVSLFFFFPFPCSIKNFYHISNIVKLLILLTLFISFIF